MAKTYAKLLFPLAVAGALAACNRGADAEGESAGAADEQETPTYQYNREYIFLQPGGDEPLIVPFTFQTWDLGDEYERGARGWVARGATWDRFIDAVATTSPAGGVWQVLPQPDLTLTAGGATELEAIEFQRAERHLRMYIDRARTGWHQGGETRFRLLQGRVAIGSEEVAGPIFEVLRIERTLEDGWPPAEDFDAIYLTSGDSLQLVLAETIGTADQEPEWAWARTSAGERSWDAADIRWAELAPFEEARRDIPMRWTFAVPAGEITGEISAIGYDAVLGPERGARHAVEIRFNVEGWVEMQGVRRDVVGMIRHTQQ